MGKEEGEAEEEGETEVNPETKSHMYVSSLESMLSGAGDVAQRA